MSRKVVVTQRFFDPTSAAYLREHGCEVVVPDLPAGGGDGEVAQATLLEWLDGAAGWIVGHARVTRDLLEALPQLKIVSRRGVGYERVDVQAVRELGRVATIAAGGNAATVADHTLGMMLALGHRFREAQERMSRGSWAIPLGTDLAYKTVGIIGLGRIGSRVAQRLAAFDARVLAYTLHRESLAGSTRDIELVELHTLLSESDYLTLHAPLTADTRFLIRRETIASMKSTAFVINTARGGLVEDRDLLAALKEGRLAGAGLDVFMSESDASYLEVTRELIAMSNVVATPHSGASTREGLDRTNMIAARCVVGILEDVELPPGCIVADGRARHDETGPSGWR